MNLTKPVFLLSIACQMMSAIRVTYSRAYRLWPLYVNKH